VTRPTAVMGATPRETSAGRSHGPPPLVGRTVSVHEPLNCSPESRYSTSLAASTAHSTASGSSTSYGGQVWTSSTVVHGAQRVTRTRYGATLAPVPTVST
jgi:hypothetical protein